MRTSTTKYVNPATATQRTHITALSPIRPTATSDSNAPPLTNVTIPSYASNATKIYITAFDTQTPTEDIAAYNSLMRRRGTVQRRLASCDDEHEARALGKIL